MPCPRKLAKYKQGTLKRWANPLKCSEPKPPGLGYTLGLEMDSRASRSQTDELLRPPHA